MRVRTISQRYNRRHEHDERGKRRNGSAAEIGRPIKKESSDVSSSTTSSSGDSIQDFHEWLDERGAIVENERLRLVDKWKAEARAEVEKDFWHRRIQRSFDAAFGGFFRKVLKTLAYLESFFANLPLTIGAIALSTANLGVDWFKFMEEYVDSCQPVQFHSAQCTFPEVRWLSLTLCCSPPF